ncbi:hypothetical protein EHS13_13580 [Paenibacillus psychroresistens]|uniref:Uncharacterized protein n=1 Tax=Paenibacillus psychroresistens TaxID=1778678 RepID=A0A6B8RJC7_9BACL|nr:hypothetical protein [Paenibacillus psychroresistens]QGQ95834.1 hypothetical protein EHS13_13580 [Paenibacillus psychroresistens]
MNKQDIVDRLLALPTEIIAAELDLINLQNNLFEAQHTLQQLKDGLYIGVWEDQGKKIDGKNAEIREAQMRQYTTIEQNSVNKAAELVNRQRYGVTCLQNELIALRAVVDLLKGAA